LPKAPSDEGGARRAALDALARRDHASFDLRRKLLAKGYDLATVTALLERLIADRLIDDQRYAEGVVAKHAVRGWGPKRIRADLRKAGLQGPAVERCISAYADWPERICAARRKKFGAQMPRSNADKLRQARFLGYRGFTSAQIRSALGFDIELEMDGEEA
jgi:regulatory protein